MSTEYIQNGKKIKTETGIEKESEKRENCKFILAEQDEMLK